jgi:uncharacterized membrane protein YidH (DUF202 family)
MFRTGAALVIAGLGVAAIGALAVESISIPLPGPWHSTFYPRGIGVMVIVVGVGLMILSLLLRERSDR